MTKKNSGMSFSDVIWVGLIFLMLLIFILFAFSKINNLQSQLDNKANRVCHNETEYQIIPSDIAMKYFNDTSWYLIANDYHNVKIYKGQKEVCQIK